MEPRTINEYLQEFFILRTVKSVLSNFNVGILLILIYVRHGVYMTVATTLPCMWAEQEMHTCEVCWVYDYGCREKTAVRSLTFWLRKQLLPSFSQLLT